MMHSPSDPWQELLSCELARLDGAHLRRHRRAIQPLDAVRVIVGDRALINFASNDYLGLSHHPRVVEAATNAISTFGFGSGAAPLITGYTTAHESAERAIAEWKGTEAAVLFSSGYQANVAVVQALAETARRGGRGARFLLDKLCHASLIDAVRAVASDRASDARADEPKATFRIFPHNHVAKPIRLLHSGTAASTSAPLDVIVTESIFSMDGDAADLATFAAVKQRPRASDPPLLLVDEAHGSGVYGPGGAGLAAELGVQRSVDVTIVTLSKAVGAIGAAVCGSRALCDVLVNLGRPYVYSTSMPAAVAAAAEAAIGVMRDEPHRQQRVRALARHVRYELAAAGLVLPPGDSPIVPILLGDEQSALRAADVLRERGLLALPIRPPTVPRGSSRLRVTLSSEHSDEQIESLLAGLRWVAAMGP